MPEAFDCRESISFPGQKILVIVPAEFEELSLLIYSRNQSKNVNQETFIAGCARHASRISG